MAYVKKTWKARQGVGLNKYTDSISGQTFALMNTPDSISQIGDAFTVANMNDLENRIDAGKVDKITGKGLSANDYTDEDKAQLASVPNFSYGTGHPSGGSNGDIYIKYEV